MKCPEPNCGLQAQPHCSHGNCGWLQCKKGHVHRIPTAAEGI